MCEWRYRSTEWKQVVSFTLRLLYIHGKKPRYPLVSTVGGHQSEFERRKNEKFPLHPEIGHQFFGYTAWSPAQTELFRLQKKKVNVFSCVLGDV
jgi:hypothetical protein